MPYLASHIRLFLAVGGAHQPLRPSAVKDLNPDTPALSSRPQIVERRCPPKLPADLWLGDVSVSKRHRKRFVAEDLPHKLQVAGLLQNARGSVVAQRVRTDLPREPRLDRDSMEGMCRVIGPKTPAETIYE